MSHEVRHRLAVECYRGQVAVVFTATLQLQNETCLDDDFVKLLIEKLFTSADKFDTEVSAWCLMPDHFHVLFQGRSSTADVWRAMTAFKQQTGFWLSRHRLGVRWQKDFYDHIVRSDESLETQMLYIAANPVRAGLVANWRDYVWMGGTHIELMRASRD